MKGYYSKKLQKNSKLYAELQENIKLYINHSILKENKQKSYLKNTGFLNKKSGEFLNVEYDFEKKYKVQECLSQYPNIGHLLGKFCSRLSLKYSCLFIV